MTSADVPKFAKRKGSLPTCERLEPRRLFTTQLDINSTGALVYTQLIDASSDLNISTTGKMGSYKFHESADTISLTPSAISWGWTLSAGNTVADGPDSSITSMWIQSADSFLAVQSTDAPVFIVGVDGTNQIVGLGGATNGAQSLAAQIDVQNSNASSQIIINEMGDVASRSYTVNPSFIAGISPFAITYGPGVNNLRIANGSANDTVVIAGTPPIATDGVSPSGVQILTSAHDTVNVQTVANGSTVDIRAGGVGATDDITVSNNGSVQGVLGQVSIENTNALSNLIVDDSADTIETEGEVDSNVIIGRVAELAPGGISFSPLAIANLTVNLGSANNLFEVHEFAGASGMITTVNGGAGNLTIDVSATAVAASVILNTKGTTDDIRFESVMNGLTNILGIVQINNIAGICTVEIVNELDTTARAFSFSDSTLTGGGASAPINLSNVANVDFTGSGMAADVISVRPSTSTTFTIAGNDQDNPPNPTNVLVVDLTGTTGAVLTDLSDASGFAGTYTFTNRKPMSFSRVGAANPNIGSISGTIFSGQTAAPVAGATLFVDANQNGALDGGEASTTSDASGNYLFGNLTAGSVRVVQSPPAGMVATPAAGFASVTVTGGTPTAGINFADAAAPIPVGPDLVASVVGSVPASVIGGATGKWNVRITNAGTTSAVGIPEIELFASPNAQLDPGETPFSTLSAGKLNLRHGASKTVNLSFHYPSDLPNGSYFLLASIDPTNVIAETNKANNLAISTSAVAIAAPFVDLTGGFAHAPKALKAGKAFLLPLIIQNLGNIPASGIIAVDLFTSSDQIVDASDKMLVSAAPVKISIKAGKSHPAGIHVPKGATVSGQTFFIAVLNSAHALMESNFGNDNVISPAAVTIV